MDPRRLLVFREVARAGSLTAAARALGWTQPAVSQHLAALERSVALPLVLRGPTGTTLTEAGEVLLRRADAVAAELHAAGEELAALARWCEEQGVQLISDEIYHGIEYADGAPGAGRLARSAWETSREAIVFASFSKYFSMTGWRIGWMLVPQRLRRAVDVLTGNFTICPPVIAQRACLAAFTPESYAELDGHVARYAGNRRLLLDGLTDLGITRLAPADGAFYAYADVAHLTDDSMAFAHELLAETGVAVAPGIDFDTVDGPRSIRFSFAGQAADVETGLERLGDFLRQRRPR